MDKKEEVEENPINPVVRTLLVWKAPSRMVQKFDKEVYSTIFAVAILFSIVFVFVKEFLLIAVVWALVFFVYALSKSAPELTENKITTLGITCFGKEYPWEELGHFWFVTQRTERILKVRSRSEMFGELVILLGDIEENKVKEILAKYLPYWEVPQKTWSDKAAEWLSTKFSFDKTPKV